MSAVGQEGTSRSVSLSLADRHDEPLAQLVKRSAPLRDLVGNEAAIAELLKALQKKTTKKRTGAVKAATRYATTTERVVEAVALLTCQTLRQGAAPLSPRSALSVTEDRAVYVDSFDEHSARGAQFAAQILQTPPMLSALAESESALALLLRYWRLPRVHVASTLRQWLVLHANSGDAAARGRERLVDDVPLPNVSAYWADVACALLAAEPLRVVRFITAMGAVVSDALLLNIRLDAVARFLCALLDAERALAKKRLIGPDALKAAPSSSSAVLSAESSKVSSSSTTAASSSSAPSASSGSSDASVKPTSSNASLPSLQLWSQEHSVLAQLHALFELAPEPHLGVVLRVTEMLLEGELYWPQRTVHVHLTALHSRLLAPALLLLLSAQHCDHACALLLAATRLAARQANRAHLRLWRDALMDEGERTGRFRELFHRQQSPAVVLAGLRLMRALLRDDAPAAPAPAPLPLANAPPAPASTPMTVLARRLALDASQSSARAAFDGGAFVPLLLPALPRLTDLFFAHAWRSVYHAQFVDLCRLVAELRSEPPYAPLSNALFGNAAQLARRVKEALLNRATRPAAYYAHLEQLAALVPDDQRPWDWGQLLESLPLRREVDEDSAFALPDDLREMRAKLNYLVGANTFGEE